MSDGWIVSIVMVVVFGPIAVALWYGVFWLIRESSRR